MFLRFNHIITLIFALLATWVIFAAIPFFRLRGMVPQVDTQVIFLHSICGLMFLYLSIRFIFNKYELIKLNHPVIIISFFLAIVSLLSSFLAKNFYASLSGSPQIGQGVFWYFDLTIMLIIFSSISQYKHVRVLLFLNFIVVTFIVSFFTFFPFWRGLPISFYYFSDYLCFYGVLNFILFTTLTKKIYLNFLAFIFLGIYISLLDNRAATLFWITSFLFGLVFYSTKFINSVNKNKRLISFLFSDGIFVFSVVTISLLTLLSSVYFWASDYNLPFSIKDTLLDAPVVRGKIIENSLYSLDNVKSILIGNGWGVVPSLLLENMNSWQYDELRLGYNLHFHTHNELVEHIVSVGIFGGALYLLLMFYVFRCSESISFESKLGWLLFFKITCFWFLWTGTLTLFAVVLACFIVSESKQSKYFFFLNKNSKKKNVIFSVIFLLAGTFLFYGAYITYTTARTNSELNYSNIIGKKQKNTSFEEEKCLTFYNDFDRGGIVLDRFLEQYSSYILSLEENKIEENALYVFYQLQCKANEIIKEGNYNSSLLNTSMQVDTNFYFKFGSNQLGINYMKRNYYKWFYKALLMTEDMPNRGDLIMPFLSYAINHNKNEDAIKVCEKTVKGIEAMCELIKANKILAKTNLGEQEIKKSLVLIRNAIKKGIFNDMVYGFWFNQDEDKLFQHWGLHGIPLSADILFLISEKEKKALEKLIYKED